MLCPSLGILCIIVCNFVVEAVGSLLLVVLVCGGRLLR